MEDGWLYGWGLGYAAVGAASLLVPLYALAVGGDAFVVGLLASTAAFAGVPGALLWGALAARTDRRRPFLLVALGATAGVLALVPLVESTLLLVVANAALWFTVSAAAPVLNLIMVSGVPEREWDGRIARLNAVQGYGWVGGLVLGTVWTAVVPGRLDAVAALQLLFFLLAIVTTVALAAVTARYPERPTVSAGRFRRAFRRLDRTRLGSARILQAVPYSPARLYWGLRSLRRDHVHARLRSPLWRYLAAATLFTAGAAVFWGPAPAYLDELGYATGEVFVLFVIANLASAVLYEPVGRAVADRGPRSLQTTALLVRVVVFPGTALAAGLAFGGLVLGVAFLALGVTWAVIAVTATGLVTRLADPEERSEALGLYTALAGLGGGVGSILGGAVATAEGYTVAFGLAGLVVLAGVGVVLTCRLPTPAGAGAVEA
jgi:MFS family permease